VEGESPGRGQGNHRKKVTLFWSVYSIVKDILCLRCWEISARWGTGCPGAFVVPNQITIALVALVVRCFQTQIHTLIYTPLSGQDKRYTATPRTPRTPRTHGYTQTHTPDQNVGEGFSPRCGRFREMRGMNGEFREESNC